jgi:uncharacterized phage-associated protein
MPYSAKAVANYFLERGFDEEVPIDPLKLQKLLYFAHGWNLGLYGTPLLSEPIEAWTHGPVIPSIYHEFKEVGNEPIDWYAHEQDEAPRHVPRVPAHDRQTRALLDRIWNVYGNFTGLRLSDMTHKPETPWASTWQRARRSTPIPDRLIEEYFRRLAARTGRFQT